MSALAHTPEAWSYADSVQELDIQRSLAAVLGTPEVVTTPAFTVDELHIVLGELENVVGHEYDYLEGAEQAAISNVQICILKKALHHPDFLDFFEAKSGGLNLQSLEVAEASTNHERRYTVHNKLRGIGAEYAQHDLDSRRQLDNIDLVAYLGDEIHREPGENIIAFNRRMQAAGQELAIITEGINNLLANQGLVTYLQAELGPDIIGMIKALPPQPRQLALSEGLKSYQLQTIKARKWAMVEEFMDQNTRMRPWLQTSQGAKLLKERLTDPSDPEAFLLGVTDLLVHSDYLHFVPKDQPAKEPAGATVVPGPVVAEKTPEADTVGASTATSSMSSTPLGGSKQDTAYASEILSETPPLTPEAHAKKVQAAISYLQTSLACRLVRTIAEIRGVATPQTMSSKEVVEAIANTSFKKLVDDKQFPTQKIFKRIVANYCRSETQANHAEAVVAKYRKVYEEEWEELPEIGAFLHQFDLSPELLGRS